MARRRTRKTQPKPKAARVGNGSWLLGAQKRIDEYCSRPAFKTKKF